jgi:hypothetical protein
MFADTDAVRTFGSANSAHAADLRAVARALSSMPDTAADAVLGPIGAGFLVALTQATTEASQAVAALAERLSAGCRNAHAAAAAYESADARTGALVSRVY